MLLGTAKALKEIEDKLTCRVILLFQPSEEGLQSGAEVMVENGIMDEIDIIAGMHVEGTMDAGKMGAEDFSRYLQRKPGVFMRIGTRNVEKGITTLAHNNDFMIDEDVLGYGSATMVQFVLDQMELRVKV